MKVKLFLLFLVTAYSCACSSSTQYKISDHYDGKKFRNTTEITPKGFLDLLKWKLSFKSADWPGYVDVPIVTLKEAPKDKLVVTFITHASFFIQAESVNILTDPIWSKRASPLSFAGPARHQGAGLTLESLPKVDIVLISHNHYDHMDRESIANLETKFSPLFITPLGNMEKVKSFGAKNVQEYDWWESKIITPDLKITLTPAQHWSSRTPFDRNIALWGSYFIESKNHKVYFAGDTGYGPHFKDIQKRIGTPTVSLLPIGAYEPRWFMKDMHMNPEEAVLAHMDLESKFSLGMHFGTFQLTDEAQDTPVKDLEMAKLKLKVNDFMAPKPGESFEF
jgi:L-ascorbate metabolism protein UlaG (beta-lactamase superfamily)